MSWPNWNLSIYGQVTASAPQPVTTMAPTIVQQTVRPVMQPAVTMGASSTRTVTMILGYIVYHYVKGTIYFWVSWSIAWQWMISRYFYYIMKNIVNCNILEAFSLVVSLCFNHFEPLSSLTFFWAQASADSPSTVPKLPDASLCCASGCPSCHQGGGGQRSPESHGIFHLSSRTKERRGRWCLYLGHRWRCAPWKHWEVSSHVQDMNKDENGDEKGYDWGWDMSICRICDYIVYCIHCICVTYQKYSR